MSNISSTDLPPNLPITRLLSVGRGWVSVAVGDLVKTSDQYYALHLEEGPNWILGSYFTSEKFKNPGFSNYRRPVSLSAWLSIFIPLMKKYSRHYLGKIGL